MKAISKAFAIFAVALMLATPVTLLANEVSAGGGLSVAVFYDGKLDNEYFINASFTIKPAVEKEGYEFQYWDLNGTHYSPGQSVKAVEFVITKQYKINFVSVMKGLEYEVNFANDNAVLETKMLTFGSPCDDLPEVSRPGYTFVGWTTDGTEKGLLNEKKYNFPYSCTLTPLWKPNSYYAQLVDGTEIIDSVVCDYEMPYPELPAITKPGYLFRGWSTNPDGTAIVDKNTVYETVGDSKLYAAWAPITYNITLLDDGVEFGKCKVSYNGTYGDLPTPAKKTGMTFIGWSTDGTRTGLVSKDTKYTTIGDSKLYAVWEANTYMATFDSDGGELSFKTKEFQYGSTIGEFPTCSKQGCTLKCWSLTKDGTSPIDANTPLKQDRDITIYAIWDEDQDVPSSDFGINLEDPVTLISLTILITGTVAVCLYIYRKGLL